MTKFFIYTRKSSEDEEKQILSIEAQIQELREFAKKESLEIVDEFVETKTAKEPGRPIFNEMLSRIEKGEAEGILAWHPDRLARNSVDGGRIIYLLDTGKIQSLKFPTFWFESTPQGKFMLNIAFGQSKYYIDNLSENVKRGLRQKLRRGEYPGVAPTGYLNNKLTKKMVPDPERFRLVKKLFELYATGNYSIKELRKIITEAGLKSRNGKVLSNSNIQAILTNPFYYGVFKFNKELYQGIHKSMITKKLFDKCQQVMADRSRPKKRGEKFYAFRGLLKCAECGCGITSETQKGHNYYRCTKKRIPCSQPYIREELLAEQISKILQKVSLNSVWAEAMIKELDKQKEQKAQAEFSFAQNLRVEIRQCKEKLDRLLDAQLEGIVSTEEYIDKKQKILNQKIEAEQKLKDFERKGNHWLEPTKNFILASKQAKIIALRGNFSELKNFLKKIGSNRVLSNRKVIVEPCGPWEILYNFAAERRRRRREAGTLASNFQKHPRWLRGLDSNQDRESQNLECYPNYTTPQNQYCLNFIKSLIL